jgi:isoquinoline 1-oxidoreductase beta subunit
MSEPVRISRRQFCCVTAVGSGALIVGVYLPLSAGAQHQPAKATAFVPNAFVRIDPDGQITIVVARPEIGQGVRTSLPMLVAEELDADWTGIRIEQALAADRTVYGSQHAGGSQSVRTGWQPLRHAGAVARAMLVAAAARQWDVSADTCETHSGTVSHRSSGRRASYGTLAAAAALLPVPTDVPLKSADRFTLIGKPTRQRDVAALVDGSQRFGLDARLPGMRFAVIERAPVIGARVLQFDADGARKIPGVTDVVPIDADGFAGFGDNEPRPANGVAVIATSTWAAMKARRALRVNWSAGATGEDSVQRLAECQRLATLAAERVVRNDGDVQRAFAGAAHTVAATYELPLVAHAAMEPMNCLADVHADRCEVWAPTQNPEAARNVAARMAALPPGSVTLHVMRCGGGFGRRFYSDFVAEATFLSRRVGAAVQVVWTREDDIRHDFYRPASYHVMRAAVDTQHRLVAWSQHLINAQRGEFLRWQLPKGATLFAAGDELGPHDFPAGYIPNLRLMATAVHGCAVPLGQWRSVEDSSNVFVYQSFIDELAHHAGADPLSYRLALLTPHTLMPYDDGRTYDARRLRQVLEVAARDAGWGAALPPGCGRGIAVSYANDAYVAIVAEVEVTPAHEVRVRRMVVAADLGTVVNPLGAQAQVEGSVIFGLSAALKQEITISAGRVVQGNFNDFGVLRMAEAPRLDVQLIASSDVPLGAGEPAVPPTAPALANAVFAATGIRVRRLPIRPADLQHSGQGQRA